MITLKEAMKLTDIKDNELCYLRNKGDDKYNSKILTGRNIRDELDMKNTFVTNIKPRFTFYGEYNGIEFEIVSGR